MMTRREEDEILNALQEGSSRALLPNVIIMIIIILVIIRASSSLIEAQSTVNCQRIKRPKWGKQASSKS